MAPRSRKPPPRPYFYDTRLSVPKNGWIRAPCTENNEHKNSRVTERRGYVRQSRSHIYNNQQSEGRELNQKPLERHNKALDPPTTTSVLLPSSHSEKTLSQLTTSTTSSLPTMSTSGSTNSGPSTPRSNLRAFGAVMPRPGQPGAMQFDGKNITEFLEEWNIECEDFGLDEPQRCVRFPNYCIPTIKETVKLLPGYVTPDWTTLQADVKKLYWPHDTPKNSMSALNKVVQEAHRSEERRVGK